MSHRLDDVLESVREAFERGTLVTLVLSGSREPSTVARCDARPVELRGRRCLQWSDQDGRQVSHRNLSIAESLARISAELGPRFRNAVVQTTEAETQVRFTKRGRLQVSTQRRAAVLPALAVHHNARPRYLIPEGAPCPFLHAIGVMTPDGRVRSQQQHKFRQINRYLEFVRDVAAELPEAGRLEVVDCGSGKSGLTFALQHFLTQHLHRDVRLVGLDRNATIVESCRRTAASLGLQGIEFTAGEIADYRPDAAVHLVVSLHACDTATDAALARAVQWAADVILAVPCCQHELAPQLQSSPLQAQLRHGILRERLAADATDALRAACLELHGYRTQVLEFIDLEHTPKNLLIRGVRRKSPLTDELIAQRRSEYEALKQALGVSTFALERLLNDASRLQRSSVDESPDVGSAHGR